MNVFGGAMDEADFRVAGTEFCLSEVLDCGKSWPLWSIGGSGGTATPFLHLLQFGLQGSYFC